MKKLLLLITSSLFVISCASNTVETSDVAQKNASSKEQVAKAETSKPSKNCGNRATGTRLKRC